MCQYFLNISSKFLQYRDNTDNRDNSEIIEKKQFHTVTSLTIT